MDVNYTIAPALPAGTTVIPASCGNIPAGGTCELTVTPGTTPTAVADIAPAPSVLSVQWGNTPTAVTSSIVVLTYGNRYQGGFVFAIDDMTADTMSVGGKVAAFTDQAAPFPNGVIWSSNGMGGTGTDSIPGIDEASTEIVPSPVLPNPNPLNFVGCNGATDGLCNVSNIFKQYPTISTSEYAAGRCTATIDGFNDCYLPAICEMGFDGVGGDPSGGGTQDSPTLQNMQSNLVGNGNIGSLPGSYWSSTEFSSDPQVGAWFRFFATGGGKNQSLVNKGLSVGVRCVRALTIQLFNYFHTQAAQAAWVIENTRV